MGLFTICEEGDLAILYSKGVLRQVRLATRDGELYAETGPNRFVRLKADGSTSAPGLRFEHLEWEGALYATPLGRLAVEPGPQRKPVVIHHGGDGFRALPAPQKEKKP